MADAVAASAILAKPGPTKIQYKNLRKTPFANRNSRRHCQSKFVYFAKTSEPDFAVIDFPAFFWVDLSGSMAAPSI